MSLFQRVGRKFEETKQAFLDAGDYPYYCEACEETLTEEYETCPHCGADAVVAVDE